MKWMGGVSRRDTTLIVYSADNGGVGSGINYPLRGEKVCVALSHCKALLTNYPIVARVSVIAAI